MKHSRSQKFSEATGHARHDEIPDQNTDEDSGAVDDELVLTKRVGGLSEHGSVNAKPEKDVKRVG